MKKKLFAVPIMAAVCLGLMLGAIYMINSFQGSEKTIIVEDMGSKGDKSASSTVVVDVYLKKLSRGVSDLEMFGLWGWSKNKLIVEYMKPWFKFDENRSKIQVESSMFPQAKTDYGTNGLFLLDPSGDKLEPFSDTGSYNYTWAYSSPDRSKMIIHEGYVVVGGNEEYKLASNEQGKAEPFAVSSYSDVKDRIRVYDTKTKAFSTIDEWEPKYFLNDYAYGRKGLQRAFGGVEWSMDGKSVVYGQKASQYMYLITVYDIQTGEKINYRMQENKGRFNRISIVTLSKDGKRLYFRGMTGPGKGFLDGYVDEDTESALYVLELGTSTAGAQKVLDNAYNCKILSDENTIIYIDNPSKAIYKSKLFIYDIAKKQRRLIDDHILPRAFDISKDESRLSFLSMDGNSFDVKLIDIRQGTAAQEVILFKAGRNATPTAPPLWNDDGSKLAVSYFTDLDTPDSTGQLCILTLKK